VVGQTVHIVRDEKGAVSMARRRSAGLDPEAVTALRLQVAEGRRPRVILSGPQFGQDAAGTVIRVGEPAVDGADFITVRVTVNGAADELAFAPAELELKRAGRAAPARPAPKPIPPPRQLRGAGQTATAEVSTVIPQPAEPATPKAETPKADTPKALTPHANSPHAKSPHAKSSNPASSDEASSNPAAAPGAPSIPTAATGGAPVGRRPPIASRRRGTASPAITVTISSTGSAWTVSGHRGAKAVAKAAPVPPGVVTAIAQLLGQEAISDAVAEINETALAEAEQRAAELRSELERLEQVLAAHRSPEAPGR
jgi:hypothetical protein